MKKIALIFSIMLAIFIASPTNVNVAHANALHDIQDSIPTDKMLHTMAGYIIQDQLVRNAGMSKFEAFLVTTGIAWAKEKYVDDHVDNGDAYCTMGGALLYTIEF